VRLEIAVDDAADVGVGQGLAHRDRRRQKRQALGQGRALADHLIEGAAVDPAHREERSAVGPQPGLVDRHDRRVLQARGDEGLAAEPRHQLVVAGQRLLERDRSIVADVVGGHDAAHPAARDLLAALVVGRIDHPELAGQGRDRRRCAGR
jgi:hypothetical protein